MEKIPTLLLSYEIPGKISDTQFTINPDYQCRLMDKKQNKIKTRTPSPNYRPRTWVNIKHTKHERVKRRKKGKKKAYTQWY
uniref:Uncharacterized protein n=1 Tax=Rhizophora mucronata TaxID=61149 RepID=A0A2P2KVU1_RHIMU